MKHLDLSFDSAAENVAMDEALLQSAEHGDGEECLRFWTSPRHFVVVGIGARIAREVCLRTCESRHIPILRRCSGGGTVVQGPGCLNYAVVLKIPSDGPLTSIRATNRLVMARHADALSRMLSVPVEVQGYTDLTLGGRKFSGNAQRRLRHYLLFHGTLLLDFDLNLISELLPLPTAQPDYRQSRSHDAFLSNLNVSAEAVKRALSDVWQAEGTAPEPSRAAVSRLVAERYGRDEWNFRA